MGTTGRIIPVIEMPDNIPYPTLHEMAYVLTQIGHMIIERAPPKHTIEGLGDNTSTVPNIYAQAA